MSSSNGKHQTPQDVVDRLWATFTTKAPGKVTKIIPSNIHAGRSTRSSSSDKKWTPVSYEQAATACRKKVDKIVRDCRRLNQKYVDPHFDLEYDLKLGNRDTLMSLSSAKPFDEGGPTPSMSLDFDPKAVSRTADVFDDPKFFVGDPDANDVRQGHAGTCWLLAALCTLCNKPGLIDRVCVARDEKVGVYGFVFHRDGEWISVVIDDKLFLTSPDFYDGPEERTCSESQYRETYQRGSGALYYAHCENTNETWVSLIEKAFAKAHGDYESINGGYSGEALEDLTGGVSTHIYTPDILDKEKFWNEELMKVNDEFLFGCSTGIWGTGQGERKGIKEQHAYSIMKAVQMNGKRLVLLRNPWGRSEWTGPWSDGSKEWDTFWLQALDHQFGDDGNFWISYEDLLQQYQSFERTRLFGAGWKVATLWTTLWVPWTIGYHPTHFELSIAKSGPVVLVLSQLDSRYYSGLEGQYIFKLEFRLHKKGKRNYLVRSAAPFTQNRSVNVEVKLEAGDYTVFMKVYATQDSTKIPVQRVMRKYIQDRRDKLYNVGMSVRMKLYDMAHRKSTPIQGVQKKMGRFAGKKRKEIQESAIELIDSLPVVSEMMDTETLAGSELSRSATPGQSSSEAVQGETETTSVISDSQGDVEKDSTSESRPFVSPLTLDPGATTEEQEDEADPSPESWIGEQGEDAGDYGDDELAKDPWNAVVTVGLHVYHEIPEDGGDAEVVKLKVVTPDPAAKDWANEGDSDSESENDEDPEALRFSHRPSSLSLSSD